MLAPGGYKSDLTNQILEVTKPFYNLAINRTNLHETVGTSMR